MDFAEYLGQVCAAVAERTGDRRGIVPGRFICVGRGSLGVDGADAVELLEHLRDRFGVDFAHFPYDRYFGPEIGFEPISFLWSYLTGRYKPLDTITVKELARFMWDHSRTLRNTPNLDVRFHP